MNAFKTLFFLLLIQLYVEAEPIYTTYENGLFSSIHVLEVDPNLYELIAVRAKGREYVLDLANQRGTIAAINGGFFHEDGSAAGLLKINEKLHGIPSKPRGAIGWADGGKKVLIDQLLMRHKSVLIPQSDPQYTRSADWAEMDYIVGGVPVLIRNGEVIEDFSSEKTIESFLTKRHPRTAVGIKEDGTWVLVVVDGRYLKFFGGMTMQQLGKFMHQQGCVEALNLDGGGSSTMVIGNEVVNTPCGEEKVDGKWVRAVSDAILVLER